MALSDGDEARDGDIWFRIATQQGHLVRGRVHHAAFGGNAIAPPKPEKGRPWTRELSGRLRSLAGSLEEVIAAAEAYCQANRGGATFSGVMYVRASDAKLKFDTLISTAVHFTPLDEDGCHADFTFTGWIDDTREEKQRLLMWLTDLFQALHHPGQLQHLPESDKSLDD